MRLELKFSFSLLLLLVSNEAQAEVQLSSSLNCYLIMHEVRAELQLSSSPLYALPCVLSRDVHAQNLEKKNLEILSTTDSKKKLEIDCKNLENSEICTDEKSRDLRFSRNVNLEKIYLYDGPYSTVNVRVGFF
jgi:hypothetical protein